MFLPFAFGGQRVSPVSSKIGQDIQPTRIALTGADFPGLRPDFRTSKGDKVEAGQTVFVDRHHPEIAFIAPAAGVVESVTLGPRRTLSDVIIRVAAKQPESQAGIPAAITDRKTAQSTLLENGAWSSFRRRPFGRLPKPGEVPEAIFINAMPERDGAPDPHVVLPQMRDAFDRGVELLTLLSDGPLFVCQPHGSDLTEVRNDRVRIHRFQLSNRTVLSTHHIMKLGLPQKGKYVWTVGWQEVAAIGELVEAGRFPGKRVIAVHSLPGSVPKLVRTLLGADLHDVFARDHLESLGSGGSYRLVSGAPIGGRESRWLGRYDTQVTLVPALNRSTDSWLRRFLAGKKSHGPSAIMPTAALDAALPVATPAVPLMRALSVGDLEAASRLGCGDLIEEDMAFLTHLCTSGSDYGRLLRDALSELETAL